MVNIVSSLFQNLDFKRYFASTFWLLSEKVLRLLVGLLVGVWVARYLGPEQFGVLSYLIAFASLFTPLSKLGLDGIVGRDVALNESDLSELMNSSAFMKFIGGAAVFIIVSAYMYLFKDKVYFYVGLLISSIYILKSFEVIEFYFKAKVKGRFVSISNCTGLILSSILKIVLIYAGANLAWFAFANFLEVAIASVFLVYFFLCSGNSFRFSLVSRVKAKNLLKESWPVIFASFFALVYLYIDQVMILEILGDYETGQYSAAARISSLWYFIPMTIGSAVQAAVVNARKKDAELYYSRLQQLFTMMALLSYVIVVPVSLFANEIIDLLYGNSYAPAGDVLALHIFASVFVFVGIIRGLWVTNESYFKFALMANLVAGVVNIGLNFLWLPVFGIIGAAWATLISYFITYLGSGLFFGPARKITFMQIKSLFMIDAFQQLSSLRGATR